ncbi:MAG: hypothetical protein PW792_00565 [Acidobacteriaceae bacterium]|nr:hypothetical protein [Acidobacteriaceae bacterium]
MTENAFYCVDFILMGAVLLLCGWLAGGRGHKGMEHAKVEQPTVEPWARVIIFAVGLLFMAGGALKFFGVL